MNDSKQMWKIDVPIDDRWHENVCGHLLHVGQQYEEALTVWFENDRQYQTFLRVYGTGQPVPRWAQYVGTVQAAHGLVWHLYKSTTDPETNW